MGEYFATVRYQEGTQLDHTELETLRGFASLLDGNPYEAATNQEAGFIAFLFGQEKDAAQFAEASRDLEKIVEVRVGRLR